MRVSCRRRPRDRVGRAAAGIAFINATGNLGGFLAPYVMGWMKDATGDYLVGLRLLATAALVSGVVVFFGTRTVNQETAETPRYRSAPS
ncbi:MAG TPA: hypothetical protein VKE96_33700 [Vicinamibacterales bacterium]|nr:hypothetical protein [Vicinamibacterales bacterium]